MLFKYRPQSLSAKRAFVAAISAGLITVFTVNPMDSIWMVLLMLMQFAVCAAILFVFRMEIEYALREQCRTTEQRRERRRAQQEQVAAKQRAVASFMELVASEAA